jgi:hypothetical protein
VFGAYKYQACTIGSARYRSLRDLIVRNSLESLDKPQTRSGDIIAVYPVQVVKTITVTRLALDIARKTVVPDTTD